MFKRDILTPQLALNWVTRILFFTSLAALLPTFPLYITEIGGNKSQIGIVMSAFAIGVFCFRPLVGKQIDKVGRKAVLLAGTAIFVIAPLLYIFIPSIAVLLPVRVFHGLGLAAFGTASITLITDVAPLTSRSEVISYTGMVNTIAFALGPVLGSFVGNKWGHPVLFTMVAAIAFLCLALSLFLKETIPEKAAKNDIDYWKAVKQRRVLVATTMILIIGLVHGGIIFYISTFIKETMRLNEGLFFAVYGMAAFVIRIAVGPLSNKFGRGPLIVGSILFLAGGIFCLSVTTGAVMLLTAAAIYGLGFGSHQPTLTTLVADNTRDETRGKIFSFYYGGFDLGISIAGIMLGMVAEHFGIRIMFLACGGLTLAALALFATAMETSVPASLNCALALKRADKECYICDQFQEVAPEQAEAYFKSK